MKTIEQVKEYLNEIISDCIVENVKDGTVELICDILDFIDSEEKPIFKASDKWYKDAAKAEEGHEISAGIDFIDSEEAPENVGSRGYPNA